MVVLASLALGLPLEGQQPVTGTVRDGETAAPLAGVYVALEQAQGGAPVAEALTDDGGRFVLVGVASERYRIRAERVGLSTTLTDPFTLDVGMAPLRIAMSERAVEMDRLDVRTDARTCDLPPDEAVVVQRWWDEIRKALQVTAVVEASEGIGLRFQRFERDLSPDLGMIGQEREVATDTAFTSRPFPAQNAAFLAERGFVQGEEGERWFLGPDAAVLFSQAFLSRHCLGIADPESEAAGANAPGVLRLAVSPTERDPPDIQGVLTVDTIAGELRSFDYRYVNLPRDLPASQAGGRLAFRYLPSGAWIVSDWWIRMPKLGLRRFGGWEDGQRRELAGYLEQGGRVVEIGGQSVDLDARMGSGVVHGLVFDSLAREPLAGARVSVVGSRLSTRSGQDGRFTLTGVPAGETRLAAHHETWARMGLPSPTLPIRLQEGGVDTVSLASPGFWTVALFLCGEPVETILTGRIAILGGPNREEGSTGAAGGAPAGGFRATWSVQESSEEAGEENPQGVGPGTRSAYVEGPAGSNGQYLQCGLPAGTPVEVAVRADDSAPWMFAGEVVLEPGRVTARVLRPTGQAMARLSGTVRSAPDSITLPGARVALVDIQGDTVGSAVADSVGRFGHRVPGAVGYRLFARAEGHWPEASRAFTLEGAERLDVVFDLAPQPPGQVFDIEGLVVEVEAGRLESEQARLAPFGFSPDGLGERWIGRDQLDSLNAMSGDPGVAITMSAIPGIRVIEAAKYGLDPHLCVVATRPNAPCAMILLNGMRIDLGTALQLDFRELESIAVINSRDAAALFGTMAGGGAVLLWTREGRR